ncbi:MAG TPA: hypothetical protein VKO18_19830, partial [Terriglobia bacterium]|nr:hypothetical protein [Terriglobia bacterium]
LNILNAMNIGDIINDVAYQIRPFEVNPGETDRVLDESMDMLQEVMRRSVPGRWKGSSLRCWARRILPEPRNTWANS